MKVFTALAEATRFQIVELLAKGELSSGEISAHFHISSPAVSQHLKVLRAARLVRVRAEAQRRIYALHPAGLAELDEWLIRIRKYWTQRPIEPERAPEASPPSYRPAHDLLQIPHLPPD